MGVIAQRVCHVYTINAEVGVGGVPAVASGVVIRFVVSVEDLARTRFAVSPMWEAIRSLVAL